MTDDQEPVESAAGGAVESSTASGMSQDISSTIAKLGAGEKLAVLGAAGVLAVWLIFDLLLDEYSTGETMFVLALGVVFAAYKHHNGGSEGWSIPYRTLVVVGGALLGILGAYYLIREVRRDIFDADGTTVVGALIFYVTSIVSGVGAWQLSRQ